MSRLDPFSYVIILTALLSCTYRSGNQEVSYEQSYPDTLSDYQSSSRNVGDTMAVWHSIDELNKILAQEGNHDKRYLLLQKKASLLGLIGEYKKAFSVQEEATELLDSNNSKRLELTAFKYYLRGDTNNYRETINKAIEAYGTDSNNKEAVIHKSILYILLGDSISSKRELQSFLKRNADQTVQDIYDDFYVYERQILEGRELLVERIAGSP